MSQLDLGTQSLELERFPPQENSNTLQAWKRQMNICYKTLI